MRRDHRPYFIKKAYQRLERFYVRRFIAPQLDHLGRGFVFMKPWHVELFGSPITIGDFATVIAAPDHRVRLSIWPESRDSGSIHIGNCCLLCPGVRIGAAVGITIEDSCMLASNVYITDADWHGIYNRLDIGASAPVHIGHNVWIGDSAIVCKGVRVGENSIVGAGAVVVKDIPANVIAGGNPARVIRELDPNEPIVARQEWYRDPARLTEGFDELDRSMLEGNTLGGWFRYLLGPGRED